MTKRQLRRKERERRLRKASNVRRNNLFGPEWRALQGLPPK